MHFVYMIKNDFGKLYIGVTENLENRVSCHNSNRGSQFTKGIEKFRIVFYEKYRSLADARKREIQLKKWRREKKELLIERHSKGLPTNLY